MCRHPIYSGRQVCGCTSRGNTGGRSHRISPTFFCCVLPFAGHFILHNLYFLIFFLRGKIPRSCDDTDIRTTPQRQMVSRLHYQLNNRGDRIRFVVSQAKNKTSSWHFNGVPQWNCCCCVFFPSILDIKFVGRTSRGHTGGRSHRIFNPPSFCGACLDFCREKDSAIPFPRRP